MRNVLSLHFNLSFVSTRYGEIIRQLHAKPSFFGATKGSRKANCHLRTNRGLADNDVVQGLP